MPHSSDAPASVDVEVESHSAKRVLRLNALGAEGAQVLAPALRSLRELEVLVLCPLARLGAQDPDDVDKEKDGGERKEEEDAEVEKVVWVGRHVKDGKLGGERGEDAEPRALVVPRGAPDVLERGLVKRRTPPELFLGNSGRDEGTVAEDRDASAQGGDWDGGRFRACGID